MHLRPAGEDPDPSQHVEKSADHLAATAAPAGHTLEATSLLSTTRAPELMADEKADAFPA